MKRTAEIKRSTPMRAKKQMNRGASTLKARASMSRGTARSTSKPAPKRMKSRGPRMTPIRRAARGQDCTLQLPGICNCDPETTALCHSNELTSGKGMGLKAPDTEAAFGCSACHDVLDGRRPRPHWMTYEMLLGAFERAKLKTHAILRNMGLIA